MDFLRLTRLQLLQIPGHTLAIVRVERQLHPGLQHAGGRILRVKDDLLTHPLANPLGFPHSFDGRGNSFIHLRLGCRLGSHQQYLFLAHDQLEIKWLVMNFA
jgi:hypothetical protein